MKILKIFTILSFLIISFINLTIPSFAQDSTSVSVAEKCRGSSGFINWQECLNLGEDNPDTYYFINNRYTKVFKDALGNNPTKETYQAAFNKTIFEFVKDIVVMLLLIFFLVLVVMGIKASFDYINAGDNDDKITHSKKTFTNIIKGLLLIIVAFILTQIFAIAFGISNIWDIKLFDIESSTEYKIFIPIISN